MTPDLQSLPGIKMLTLPGGNHAPECEGIWSRMKIIAWRGAPVAEVTLDESMIQRVTGGEPITKLRLNGGEAA